MRYKRMHRHNGNIRSNKYLKNTSAVLKLVEYSVYLCYDIRHEEVVYIHDGYRVVGEDDSYLDRRVL